MWLMEKQVGMRFRLNIRNLSNKKLSPSNCKDMTRDYYSNLDKNISITIFYNYQDRNLR